MSYRPLTADEKSVLIQNGCRSASWDKIQVKDGFKPENYRRVNFSGNISLGLTDEPVMGTAGLVAPPGIYDASLQDCNVGDNVHIARIAERIINYNIENHAYITNVGSAICTGSRAFGNGTEVNVLDETGGRKVPIYEGLSAQIAYLIAMYRHNRPMVDALRQMIDNYAQGKKSAYGRIGRYAKLTNIGSITDVNFDDESYTNGSSLLWDGTLGKRSFMGPNVVAEHFILASEAQVDKGATLKNVFVGQASTLSYGFTANDSLIFSNCLLESGEGVSIFAGPHTVSMHKSTLLIGGLFSFFNAGSGTNQSNHLYKIGPVHHGIMERGCKTGSNAYVMWPARFGYFSLVAGNHYKHPDTSSLPYSYVIDREGKSLVIPAANFATVGTIRDILKWSDRDNRSPELPKLDILNYEALNPVTTALAYRAISFLNEYTKRPEIADSLNFTIKDSAIKRGRQLYALGVDFFMGMEVVRKVLSLDVECGQSLDTQLAPKPGFDSDAWIDLAGMIVPKKCINEICDDISAGKIDSLSQLDCRLREIDSQYNDFKWNFVAANFSKCYSRQLQGITPQALEAIIMRWTETVSALDHMRKADALKDFSESVMVGFGIDGDKECRRADFSAVRGKPDKSAQIIAIHDHYADALQDGYAAIRHLEKFLKHNAN